MPLTPRLALAPLAVLGFVLAGCSQPPFDASSPWVPTDPGSNRAFTGGLQAGVPRSNFAAFETGEPTFEDEQAPQTEIPRRDGENPWATQARNPVVTVCYGSWVNDEAAVRAEAQRICPDGSKLRLLGQDSFWNGCPLLQPNRAAFRCDTGSAQAESGG